MVILYNMKTTKQDALRLIKLLMQEHNIRMNEVAQMFEANFDLLCIKDGKKTRLPFNVGKDCNPSGIFPFKESDVYLELTETEESLRKFADELRLPTLNFCKMVYAIRDELNKSLELLGRPIIKGCYFADGNDLYRLNWIVGFDDTSYLTSDYYNNDEKAKIRYVGNL